MKRIAPVVAALTCVAIFATSARGATVRQWTVPGKAFINRKDLFPRDLVHGKLVTNVVLPQGYKSRACWPVLYLLHGTADSPQPVSLQWLQLVNGELLKMHIPAILVIPGSGDTWWIDNWWHGNRHPGFEDWVLQDIVPLVEKRLNVCPGRAHHSIAGLSMGGYGAIYLASQLPGYFGSAGSFSGVLSPESPNFQRIFPQFPTYWGPVNHFYAIGHDPLALVDNLRNTRVFVGVGDGVPTADETTSPIAEFEESEFDTESAAFVNRARAAHVAVHFDQHRGDHDGPNWIETLTHMLAWKPFAPVVGQPADWTFSTVDSTGDAWGYRFAFSRYHPPTQVEQFTMRHGALHVRGRGTVTITPPNGKPVTAKIPFDLKGETVTKAPHAKAPVLVGGYQKITPLTVTASPTAASPAQPITVSFETNATLPKGDEYKVGLISLSSSTPGCTDTTTQSAGKAPAGRTITVSLTPPASATSPGLWCSGTAEVGVTEAPANSRGIGTILGYVAVTIQ